MLNHYETVFIVTPVLSEVQMKEAVEKFRGIITSRDGEIVYHWLDRHISFNMHSETSDAGLLYVPCEIKVEATAG